MITLDMDFVEMVEPVISRTWNAIGYDIMEAQQYEGDTDPISSLDAIGVTLDADHPAAHGGRDGKATLELLREAYDEHGYREVVIFLAEHIHLGY